MSAIDQIKEALYNYEQKNGKKPEIITVSRDVIREVTSFLPNVTVNRWRLFGVEVVVSDALSGKTFVFCDVREVSERPDKEMVYHWVGCCLPGNCHDVNGKMCPYHCRTNCRRALAADFAFYAWGELLNGKKGGNR